MKKLSKFLISLLVICLFIPGLKAASATFKTTANKSSVVVGNTFTVTVKVSSANTLGSWEYTISYDSSIIQLVSGKKSVADPGNGSQKSQTYTYTFKAIKSGKSNITVKSYAAYGWDEKALSCSASGTSVKVITKAELQASYSKDNNLKSLSVDGATISPTFSKDVTDYKVELGANTTSIVIKAAANDSKAHVSGAGTYEVAEGDNKFQIVVTAENGSTKTYNLIASVIDPNPITVKDIKNNELVVVKRKALLTAPESYKETTTSINNQEVPAFTSEITNFILVGLKNNEGKIDLYIYDKEKNTFTKYTELKLNELVLLPMESDSYKNYIKTTVKIDEDEIDAYKYKEDSKFAIIYALNTENGEKNYYKYDLKNNTVTFIDDEIEKELNSKIQTYSYIILGLLVETFILFIILILLLRSKALYNKRKKMKLEEAKIKFEEANKKSETEESKEELKKEEVIEENIEQPIEEKVEKKTSNSKKQSKQTKKKK